MLLADVARTLETVSQTRARSAKTAALADLLRRTDPADASALVGMLIGRVRQGRIGVGWRTVVDLRSQIAPSKEPGLSVREVDDALEQIAHTPSGAGSAGVRRDLIGSLFAHADSAESDLLARILTGEVRTGALEGIVIDALAAATDTPATVVRRAVMLSGDLGLTAELALREPAALADVGLRVGVPVQPMLASTSSSVEDAISTAGESSVEHKLDGARIQVHRDGDDVLVVTRSLADVTARVPEIVERVRALPIRSAIFDGETLLLDDDGAPRPFQDTMSRFGRHGVPDSVLRPWFFDVLHLDGTDLIDEPLRVRRGALADVAAQHLIASTVTDDPAAAQRVLDEALASGQEGVMVKSLDAPYAAGRRGKAWLKVKPVHTYDLVVLGAEWGSGRRTGWLSNLHLGARDPEGVAGEPGGFVMVGKTFKGLTDELLRWQTETFPAYETRRTTHAVFLRPEIVVEIAIDGVQRSSRYPGGVALRFARVKGYRPDKSPAEADTINSLQAQLR
ncbi:ATP-dependent DNA ligase [Epidermidibacterium keratini]|uniref:Probable DNA ligase n=1 Tax=Epidermidibacterium keratini TaxID=1891644 RepID=A0A7L4YSB7_9ACTN|nr:ATP-dependent DNA ligase [Epidermidibacterium keratini]QHC01863.1 ATP-dependent DNA ligase [Epidermidibacterium keratini]